MRTIRIYEDYYGGIVSWHVFKLPNGKWNDKGNIPAFRTYYDSIVELTSQNYNNGEWIGGDRGWPECVNLDKIKKWEREHNITTTEYRAQLLKKR